MTSIRNPGKRKPPSKNTPGRRVTPIAPAVPPKPTLPPRPSPKLNDRQRVSADKLKQTVRGSGGDIPGGTVGVGGAVVPISGLTPQQQQAVDAEVNRQRIRRGQGNAAETAQAYTQMLANQGYDMSHPMAQLETGTAYIALRANELLGGLPTQLNAALQSVVGGTPGTKRPVDRSEANKRAWETRKKRYGSSGRKDS